MKVLIDVDALMPPVSGIGRYTANLVAGLQSNKQITELKYIQSGNIIDDLLISGEPPGIRKLARQLPFKPLMRWARQQYMSACFKMQSIALTDYIYHGPNYTLLPFKGRSVVTIHDLSFLRHPEFHPADRVSFWSKQVKNVVQRADQIITDSEFQKAEICELLQVNEKKVSSVYLGVEPCFRPYTYAECRTVLQKYALEYKQFNLVVATIEPRKNFEGIIKAFNELPISLKKAYPLIIVGDKGWLSEEIHNAINQLIEAGYAQRLGYVDDADLPMLYAAAALFIYPSFYEGFGLPVLEAMASGTCVLTANNSSLSEVAGQACMQVDAHSTAQLTEAWHALLSDEALREEYAQLGVEQAKTFTWEKCVKETIEIYENVC